MRNLAVAAALLLAAPAFADGVQITAATLAEPTARYDHAVLGDALEWGALRLMLSDGSLRLFRLPERASSKMSPPALSMPMAMAGLR
jgi:hypothetical protein